MKTALRHPAAGMDRLCRWSRSTGSTDGSTGRRAFLAAPLLIPLVIPAFIPLLTVARGTAPADIHPVERAGWILDASDR